MADNFDFHAIVGEVNVLFDSINHQTPEILAKKLNEQCEKRRSDRHREIDQAYDKKKTEIDRFVQENFQNYQTKQARAIQDLREQASNATPEQVQRLKETLHNIEQNSDFFNVETVRLNTGELDSRFSPWQDANAPPPPSYNEVVALQQRRFDLAQLMEAGRTLQLSGKYSTKFAANETHALIENGSKLRLYDYAFNIVKQTETIGNHKIRDIRWCSLLSKFFILIEDCVYSLDEATMSVRTLKEAKNDDKYLCLACTEDSFLLAYDEWSAEIEEFTLSSSTGKITEENVILKCSKHERIFNLEYHEGNVALVIGNRKRKEFRLELKIIHNMETVWSLNFDVPYDPYGLCKLSENEWLVATQNHNDIYQISSDGKVKDTRAYFDKLDVVTM
ncbi:unnamed protein product, partial [Didymodactylos carnosus]